jgi:hypothetical protein
MMGIPLRHGEAAVAHQLLDGIWIYSALSQTRSERMPFIPSLE